MVSPTPKNRHPHLVKTPPIPPTAILCEEPGCKEEAHYKFYHQPGGMNRGWYFYRCHKHRNELDFECVREFSSTTLIEVELANGTIVKKDLEIKPHGQPFKNRVILP
jgi:hypothetical protein